MTASDDKPKRSAGCLPVVAIFLLLGAGGIGWVNWKMGGVEGFQRDVFLVGTVEGIEKHVLAHRPDGIAESEIVAEFAALRRAVKENRIDQEKFHAAVRDYLRRFKGTGKKPSDGELRAFLDALRAVALSAPPENR